MFERQDLSAKDLDDISQFRSAIEKKDVTATLKLWQDNPQLKSLLTWEKIQNNLKFGSRPNDVFRQSDMVAFLKLVSNNKICDALFNELYSENEYLNKNPQEKIKITDLLFQTNQGILNRLTQSDMNHYLAVPEHELGEQISRVFPRNKHCLDLLCKSPSFQRYLDYLKSTNQNEQVKQLGMFLNHRDGLNDLRKHVLSEIIDAIGEEKKQALNQYCEKVNAFLTSRMKLFIEKKLNIKMTTNIIKRKNFPREGTLTTPATMWRQVSKRTAEEQLVGTPKIYKAERPTPQIAGNFFYNKLPLMPETEKPQQLPVRTQPSLSFVRSLGHHMLQPPNVPSASSTDLGSAREETSTREQTKSFTIQSLLS